jgi:hypothetical protein
MKRCRLSDAGVRAIVGLPADITGTILPSKGKRKTYASALQVRWDGRKSVHAYSPRYIEIIEETTTDG